MVAVSNASLIHSNGERLTVIEDDYARDASEETRRDGKCPIQAKRQSCRAQDQKEPEESCFHAWSKPSRPMR
jgi:hypothetical protein